MSNPSNWPPAAQAQDVRDPAVPGHDFIRDPFGPVVESDDFHADDEDGAGSFDFHLGVYANF